ncbi:HlyD family secretion protein [Paracoccus aminophilus]|uniref:Secretion protein, HlyD family protein n=1 Tax=Paracoccus aminophilus JCM 7686 TaxID=1367847 RepID=S5XPB0_PARAH|nr:efflux RND transporter periplasmic adaptor subunit [Paracoccus aminophilus]AGT09164.1 secretion protein, HlyD family protein [Paracoccus aminophilus JCM 7686]
MSTRKLIATLVLVAALGGGTALWAMTRPAALVVQGEVEATRIDLASRVSGRVAEVAVDFGDRVQKGETLVLLSSPQLQAGQVTAQAALAVAEANRDLTFSTRPETIAAREAELAKAEGDVALLQKNYDRIAKLRDTAVVSAQTLDEVSNALASALRAREAASANLALARNGNSPEQRAVAQAQAEQAAAALGQTEADLAELTVVAPIDGQVTARMAEPGKNFAAGSPLLSIVDVDHAWFTFNLREDFLGALKIGDEIEVRLPALGDKRIRARVSAINVQGSYANWRATKATGDFDRRTFALRAVPLAPDAALRPGMSALIEFARP